MTRSTPLTNNDAKARIKLMASGRKRKPHRVATKDDLLKTAKAANKESFGNYVEIQIEHDGKKKTIKEARGINEMIDDIFMRLLGFPKLAGESLFDHDIDSGRIVPINEHYDLFAWFQIKMKLPVRWTVGPGMVSKAELFSGLRQRVERFEGIGRVPHWPMRNDIYYIFDNLPTADSKASKFNELVGMFRPETEEDATALRILFAAPLYYRESAERPTFIIQSNTGQGSGKTRLIQLLGYLYGDAQIEIDRERLKMNTETLSKDLVGIVNRMKRIVLIDNITGRFASEALSRLITTKNIQARAPYGRQMEDRKNDLLWCITSNSAVVDRDLASRSWFINLVKPKSNSPTWEDDVRKLIEKNRNQILADIIGLLSRPLSWSDKLTTRTRFSLFEKEVAAPMSGSFHAFTTMIGKMLERAYEADTDTEDAALVRETFFDEIRKLGQDPDRTRVFIRSNVCNDWVGQTLKGRGRVSYSARKMKDYAKIGSIPEIDLTRERMSGTRGVYWRGMNSSAVTCPRVYIVNRIQEGQYQIAVIDSGTRTTTTKEFKLELEQ